MKLQRLYDRITAHYGGEKLVFSEGGMDSGLLLIGEAPGREEILRGRPFVGKAGKNLDMFLEALGLRRQDICITNVCKFRPCRTGAGKATANRPPTIREIREAQAFLLEEIGILDPALIVTLGNTPLRAVLDDFSASIGGMHGRVAQARVAGKARELMPLYHPASIIYNRGLKEVYDEDVRKLARHLQS